MSTRRHTALASPPILITSTTDIGRVPYRIGNSVFGRWSECCGQLLDHMLIVRQTGLLAIVLLRYDS